MAEKLSGEQIEEIATQASDYDNWIINKRDPEQGPAYAIAPHILRALCDMALASLSPPSAEQQQPVDLAPSLSERNTDAAYSGTLSLSADTVRELKRLLWELHT